MNSKPSTKNLDDWEIFLEKVSKYAVENLESAIRLGNENINFDGGEDLLDAYSSVVQGYSEHFQENLELLRKDEGFERVETADIFLKLGKISSEREAREIAYRLENSNIDVRGLRNLREMTERYLK